MKVCSQCNQLKDNDQFYEGPGIICKKCVKARSKAYREEHIEKERQRCRTYQKANRIDLSEYKRKYRLNNPLQYKAHYTVKNALKSGTLIKGTCVFCGSKSVEAHHSDYSFPLIVTWVCSFHHKHLHKILRRSVA